MRRKDDERALERWQQLTGRTHINPDDRGLALWLINQAAKK
jgi:hypothetical protein